MSTSPRKSTRSAVGRHAGDIDDDFDRAIRLDDVEGGMVFARVGPLLGAKRCGQVGEDLAEVVGQLARLSQWEETRTRARGS